MAARRSLASHLLARSGSIWPIKPGSQTPPTNWTGWPNGKKFAVVLTHDVEGPRGLDRCLQLAELEESLSFRSSFNFIPEGDYKVPPSLRAELVRRGFEVGVHDLHHDGKLYTSRREFHESADRINSYLRDWNAVGFRSGFMHHNLDWLHDLDIAYDMSTFDTDPFEPQPDGVETIFPFWVPTPSSASPTSDSCPLPPNSSSLTPDSRLLPRGSRSLPPAPSPLAPRPSSSGYLELPYTLPQDSTLFLLLEETDITVWKKKLQWIAQHGGMALINIHPDYISFQGKHTSSEYPVTFYSEFLAYLQKTFASDAWFALPCDIARYFASSRKKKLNVLFVPAQNSASPAVEAKVSIASISELCIK